MRDINVIHGKRHIVVYITHEHQKCSLCVGQVCVHVHTFLFDFFHYTFIYFFIRLAFLCMLFFCLTQLDWSVGVFKFLLFIYASRLNAFTNTFYLLGLSRVFVAFAIVQFFILLSFSATSKSFAGFYETVHTIACCVCTWGTQIVCWITFIIMYVVGVLLLLLLVSFSSSFLFESSFFVLPFFDE